MILTPLQKLPNNVGYLGKIIVATGFEWLPKVQKNCPNWSHCLCTIKDTPWVTTHPLRDVTAALSQKVMSYQSYEGKHNEKLTLQHTSKRMSW